MKRSSTYDARISQLLWQIYCKFILLIALQYFSLFILRKSRTWTQSCSLGMRCRAAHIKTCLNISLLKVMNVCEISIQNIVCCFWWLLFGCVYIWIQTPGQDLCWWMWREKGLQSQCSPHAHRLSTCQHSTETPKWLHTDFNALKHEALRLGKKKKSILPQALHILKQGQYF